MSNFSDSSDAEASGDAIPDFPTLRTKLGDTFDTTQIFTSPQEFITAFQQFSLDKGYSIVKRSSFSLKNGRIITYECDRSGKPRDQKNKNLHITKRRQSGSRRIDCPFKMKLREDRSTGLWTAEYVIEEHNHEASDDASAHPANRIQALDTHQQAEALVRIFISRHTKVSTIKATVKKDFGLVLTKRDIYNIRARYRLEQLGGLTALQWLIRELQILNYFVRFDTDENNRLTRLFFAHPECIKLWKKAPDVILMDATYKTNRFNQPCINICGSMGNNKTPQLAIAFLSGEELKDYMWVLQQMLILMQENDIAFPKLFITDRELALMNAIEAIFPECDHIICRWHVNMNVVAKTKKFFKYQEDFDEFFQAWLILLASLTQREYEDNLKEFRKMEKYSKEAVSYCIETWLIWREKLVRILLTSP
jgi:hypothetical protein